MALVKYYMNFGKLDSSEVCEWNLDLTKQEQEIYNNELNKIKALKGSNIVEEDLEQLNTVSALKIALDRAEQEILQEELSNMSDDEYLQECMGETEMDEDKLEELVHSKDPYALSYFGLENANDEEIEEWEACDLDEIPTVCEFDKDFIPECPYDLVVYWGID